MTGILTGVMRRDLTLAWRRRADLFTTLVFFVIVASLFPLGIGAETRLLRAVGPGVAWVSALLACLLALPRLFAADHADGTLEQMLLSPAPLTIIILGKVLAHWLSTSVPLVVVAPLIGLQFGLPAEALAVLAASLLLGTPEIGRAHV